MVVAAVHCSREEAINALQQAFFPPAAFMQNHHRPYGKRLKLVRSKLFTFTSFFPLGFSLFFREKK